MTLLGLLVAASVMGKGKMEGSLQREPKAAKDARMEWWRDARLGMFIHWGLYSIPAGEYNGQTGHGEWIRETAQIPVGEYEKYAPQFNPTKFDADAWVKMAADAGMKYVVITTKHHDGFGLFQSQYTTWDVGSTPFGRGGRDVMAEMAAACKKYGLKMCWYHSIMDWHHPDYLPRRTWETGSRPADGADMDRYVKYLRNQVTELLTKYGPIGVMWFDGEWESTWSDKYGKPLYELCRKLQPNVIVNNRVSNNRGGSVESDGQDQRVGDFSTPEQTIPATGLPGVDWETCMTMNDHWGYNSHDRNWKSSKELIRNIVDIASKGGNYLLNVGPKADGTFPPEAVERLSAIGKWMKANGESIYGTTASEFENLAWGRSTTRVNRQGDTILYFHVFDWPKDGRLVIPGIGNQPVDARWLHIRHNTKVVREGSDIVISAPDEAPDSTCSTVMLTVKGKPIIYKTPQLNASSDVFVNPHRIEIDAPDGLEVRYTLDGTEPTSKSRQYVASLTVNESTMVKAAGFDHGKRVTAVAMRKFARVAPWAATHPQRSFAGLRVQEFNGSYDKVPDFPKLRFSSTSIAKRVEIPPYTKAPAENVARMIDGLIEVPKDALYRFALLSDDGSKLWIDGKLIVDNDGLHSSETKIGAAPLQAGKHHITVGWFNKTGGSALELKWAADNLPFSSIPETAFSYEALR